jgi:hypothetical protein
MKRWPLRQVLALMLGVLLALGMSLSAVQASDMALAMAATGGAGSDDCSSGCGGDDGGKDAKAMTCAAVCIPPAVAVLAPTPSVAFDHTANVQSEPDSLLPDWASSPDPYPPRSIDLG